VCCFSRCSPNLENGKAQGVEVLLDDGRRIKILARITVASAGSIHTPALLLRSTVPNSNIGKHLRLHPVSAIAAIINSDNTEPFGGCIMSWYSDQAGNLDGKGYGVKLETPSVHPGLFGTAATWNSPLSFKTKSIDFNRSIFGIALARDRDSGSVTVDKKGAPRIHYPLSQFDRNSIVEGLVILIKLLVVNGAKEIYTGHELLPSLKPKSTDVDAPEVKQYIAAVRKLGIQDFRQPIFSAHQMGSCRLGSSPKTSVINATGESWEIKNLFVADASTFPTASGVNPMITTESISHYIAQRIKDKLSKLPKQASKL